MPDMPDSFQATDIISPWRDGAPHDGHTQWSARELAASRASLRVVNIWIWRAQSGLATSQGWPKVNGASGFREIRLAEVGAWSDPPLEAIGVMGTAGWALWLLLLIDSAGTVVALRFSILVMTLVTRVTGSGRLRHATCDDARTRLSVS